jgi:hypothetical protein
MATRIDTHIVLKVIIVRNLCHSFANEYAAQKTEGSDQEKAYQGRYPSSALRHEGEIDSSRPCIVAYQETKSAPKSDILDNSGNSYALSSERKASNRDSCT